VHVVGNWIWQGVVLTLVADVAMRSARLSASTRYVLWWVVMVLVLLLPVLPDLASMSSTGAVSAGASPSASALTLPDAPVWPLFIAVWSWAAWALVSAVRLVVSTGSVVGVRRAATAFPAAREARLAHWQSVRESGRRARLAISDRVRSASAIGLGTALIAVSPEAAGQLTDEELDQVVLHEWAHVQRRDDYARLVQVVVRCVAGVHPAVWWIGRRLEIEREIACDDYAVNVTGGARALAVCLTKLAVLQQRSNAVALAPGVIRASQLTVRVRRLLDPRRNTSTRRPPALLASAAIGLTIVATALARFELVAAASPVAAPAIRVPAVQMLVPASPADARRLPDVQLIDVVGTTQPATIPTNAPAQSADQTRGIAAEPIASPATSPKPIEPVANAPIERLGPVAWQPSALPGLSGARPAAGSQADDQGKITTPWGAAADTGISIGHGSQTAASATADAGTSVGRGSQKAAVATAGFFTKLSRKIAGSF
jgi:beta-lactamase regulating signal transducer with metallopeptidase domain